MMNRNHPLLIYSLPISWTALDHNPGWWKLQYFVTSAVKPRTSAVAPLANIGREDRNIELGAIEDQAPTARHILSSWLAAYTQFGVSVVVRVFSKTKAVNPNEIGTHLVKPIVFEARRNLNRPIDGGFRRRVVAQFGRGGGRSGRGREISRRTQIAGRVWSIPERMSGRSRHQGMFFYHNGWELDLLHWWIDWLMFVLLVRICSRRFRIFGLALKARLIVSCPNRPRDGNPRKTRIISEISSESISKSKSKYSLTRWTCVNGHEPNQWDLKARNS